MVRFASSLKDKNEAFKMWSQCFTDSSSYVEYYFSKRYDNRNFLIYEKEGEIQGGAHLNPYSFNFLGAVENSWYLVAVATFPEHRGQGVLKYLMDGIFKEAKEKKIREIFLHPIDSQIYKKYGFAFTHFIQEYRVSSGDLRFNSKEEKERKRRKVKIIEISPEKFLAESEENFEESEKILSYINKNLQEYSSSLLKSGEDFRKYLDELSFEGGHLYKVMEADEITGAFSYTPDGKTLQVRDLFFKDGEIFERIGNFLKSFKDYYSEIVFQTPLDYFLENYFSNPEKIQKIEIPFMMIKIIDKERVLNEFFSEKLLKREKKIRFSIKIWDSYEKKHEIFSWGGTEGTLENFSEKESEERGGRSEREEVDMSADWEILTSFIYGGVDLETAEKQKKILISPKSDLYGELRNLKIKKGFMLEFV